jgi:hypothetical protein
MKTSLILIAVIATMATATASVTTDGFLVNQTIGASAPMYFTSDKYPVTVGPGDSVSASLSYAADATTDLDLTLYSPFYDSVPIPPTACGALDVNGCVAAAGHYVDQRVGRTTCTDATAVAQNHADGGEESFATTLAAGAQSGKYQLGVVGFLQTQGTSYTLTVTVLDGNGNDVTAARLGEPVIGQTTINGWAYCDVLSHDLP